MTGVGYGLVEGTREGISPEVVSASRCICRRWPTSDDLRAGPFAAELRALVVEGKLSTPDLFLDLEAARRYASGRRLLGFEVDEVDADAAGIEVGSVLAGGSASLGFELVTWGGGLGHSMRCNAAEGVAMREGIALNHNGLFLDVEGARRTLTAVRDQGFLIEDGPWVVVHIVEFAL